jgi:pimeloyl-ACP methyl ester carboxylesterase
MAFKKSTIVRSIFQVLETTAPALSIRLAERLWCTIPGGASATAAKPGRLFTIEDRIVAEKWGSGPIVYLVHGWGGVRGQLDPFVAPLVQSGHTVVAFDAPSHGDSAPGAFGRGRGLLPEFSEALATVVKHFGEGRPAHGVIAHSLGSAATAIAILDGLAVERAVLIAPMADPIPYTVEFGQMLGFGERTRTGFLRRLEHRVGRAMSDFDIPARLGESEEDLPPILVVHDLEDKEVHYRDGALLAAVWPEAEFLGTTGLGHRRILRDEAVIQRAIGHLAGARV